MSHPRRTFPTGVFVLVVFFMCLGLAVTAWFGYYTLSRLRVDYLRNRGNEIAAAIDAQMRGSMRRTNLEAWGSTIEESLQAYGDSLAFIALLGQSRELLTGKGSVPPDSFSAPPGFAAINGSGIYIFEMALPGPRQSMMGMGHRSMPALLRIGLYTSSADFIRRQAIVQLVVVGLAILVLLALSYYFLRTLDRFLELEAREDSERHLRSLGTMAATLAHEIRNPLGAMKGLTQLAQENLPGEHGAQPLMKTVVSEAERLERLVTDLLTFARPPQPQFSTFDFAQLLSDVKAMLDTKLEAAGTSLEIAGDGGPMIIESDESGLRQVLLNVIFNAMDATPKGGAAIVRARRTNSSRELTVEIDDAGPGLGDRDSEELFQPFATTKIQGTGLGLAVSRRIIESLGGSLMLANRPEGGARCTIIFPVAKE